MARLYVEVPGHTPRESEGGATATYFIVRCIVKPPVSDAPATFVYPFRSTRDNEQWHLAPGQWEVLRRYSEFAALHRVMRSAFRSAELPDLPPKKPFATQDKQFLDARARWLNEYLRAIAENPVLLGSRAVADFLNVLPRLVRSEASAAASQAGGSGSSAAREEEAVTNYRDTRGATGGAGGAGDGDVPAAGASSGRMRPFSRPSAVAETVARGAVARSLANNSASTTVLYSTFSVCPYCAIRSTRGLTWFPAKVVEYKAAVWLVTECPTHGPHESLYCSNVDFFKRITSFDEIIRNWNARMLRRGSDRARVGTRTPGSGTSALAPAPVAATPPPPTAHGEKEDESPNDESSSDRARASQTTRPAIPPRSPPSEVDTAGCPVPLPVELPLSEEAEKALADWAMDGPEASSVVEKYVGWNYWDDGGLPPSHPSHPSQRGRAAGTPAKGASVPLTPPIGAHGITAPSVVREEHKSHVAVPAPIADIEDLHSRLNFATPDPVTGAPANLPTILEFSVFENGAFKSNRDIERQFVTLTRRFPRGYSFVCRVNGSLGMDIAALNERVGFLIALVARRRCWCPVWVEVSAPRLVLLAKLEESVLRLSTVFPALQVFVGRGAEDAAVAELEELEEAMERFPEISILAMLSIDRPFPDLRRVMAWLRSRPQRFRLINLKLERSPTQLVTQLQRRAAARSSFATARAAAADVRSADTLADSTVDPFELLELLEEQTDGQIQPQDFAPLSFGQALEPLLPLLGFGQVSLRVSSFCAFAVVLLNSSSYHSVPASRLLDMPRLLQELLPAISGLDLSSGFGVMDARKIRKVLQRCAVSGVKLPKLTSVISSDKSVDAQFEEFFDSVQMVMVHNTMDIGALDAVRRCNCGTVSASAASRASRGVVASCTGCI